MLAKKNVFVKIDDFQVFAVLLVNWLDFEQKYFTIALTLTKSPCLILLKPDKTLLMQWL